jgi:hypothetical protein
MKLELLVSELLLVVVGQFFEPPLEVLVAAAQRRFQLAQPSLQLLELFPQ